MSRRKSNKEYCLVITIDNKDYYTYGYSGPRHIGGKLIVRLTEDPSKAKKLKTLKLLEKEIFNITIRNTKLKLGRKVIASSKDMLQLKLEYLTKKYENDKKEYFKIFNTIKNTKLFSIKNIDSNSVNVMVSLNQMRQIVSEIPSQYRNIRNLKKQMENVESNRKVEIKILDASHNFRYSKLKKLIQENGR